MLADSLYGDREVVKETEWTRVYSVGPNQLYYESKFARDNLQVSAQDIGSRWNTFNESEKIDFVTAFQSKYPLTTEDEDILELLMHRGDESIWAMIALQLTAMSTAKHEKVLEFLLSRVKQERRLRSNYYQALAALQDSKAVPILKAAYEEERTRIYVEKPLKVFEDIFPYTDYLHCCMALYRLTGAEEYKAAIERLAAHTDERVRAQVKLASRP
jgi:hypothetical protein